MTFVTQAANIFVDPAAAFASLESKRTRSATVPFLLEAAAPALLLVVYYSQVNLIWFQDHLTVGVPAEQRASVLKLLSPTVLAASSAVTLLLTTLFFTALLAGYFYLVAKVRNAPQGYGKWFSLVVWASLPSLLLLPVGLFTLLMSGDGRVLPEQLNAVSANQMIAHLEAGNPWKNLLDSISLILIWCVGLMAVGIRSWTGVTAWTAVAIATAPYALIYGTWAAIIVATSGI